jgi:soluble lytic murein transglycosylase
VRLSTRLFPVVLLGILSLAACQRGSPPTLMPTAVPPGGAQVALSASVLPSPLAASATPVPTDTATPTATPTPTPTSTPSPTPQPEALLQLAGRALAYGDNAEAEASFQAILGRADASEANERAALLGLADAQLSEGLFADAESTLAGFLSRFPDAPETPKATFWLGRARQGQMNWQGAIEAFQAYLALDPTLSAYISDMVADGYLALGDNAAALEAYEAALTGAATSDKVMSLRERLAQAYLAAGQVDAAIAQYDAIRGATEDRATLARMDYLSGYALLLNGRGAEGYERYLHAVNTYPDAYDSYMALIALVEAGYPVDDFQRGLVDYSAGACLPAINAFYRQIEADPYNHPADGHLYVARCYVDLGNYSAALTELDVLIETHPDDPLWVEGRLEKAKVLAAMGETGAAVQSYLDFAVGYPADGMAPVALWRAADLWERVGAWNSAREVYAQLAAAYPAHQDAAEALLRAGLMAYRAGDTAGALEHWQALIAGYPGSEWAAPALVWLLFGGELGGAMVADQAQLATYQAQVAALPADNYYSLRAADLISGVIPFDPPATIVWAPGGPDEQAEAEAWLRGWLGLDPAADVATLSLDVVADPRWQRGIRLWDLGLATEGPAELNAVRYDYRDNALISYQLALAFRDMGLYRSSILAAEALIRLSPAATALEAPPFVGRLAYPAYYRELVESAAADYDVDPLLILAMIRQESLFESFAESWAAAQGLMQVIPSTGEGIARQLGWPNYRNEDLFKPYVSVRFGTYYLAQQLAAFDGKPFVALSAYNGGPGNASRWHQTAPDSPDLYLEVITLGEPRRYIQRIYSHYHYYRALYGGGE